MSYQPAHAPSLTKHNNQLFEFDSPATIAKQQEHQQLRPMQAGGAPPGFSSAPAPPALPQLGLKPSSRSMRLKTRDWSNQPWKTNSTLTGADSYRPPSSLTSSNLPSSQKWGDHTISNTISSTPRTPNLLGVYDPTLLSGQTTHLQHHDHKTHSIPQTSQYSSGSNLPLATSALPLATSALPVTSGGLSPSSALHSSGLPTSNYVPSSTIPISHDYHLPSSNLAHSTGPISGPALSKASTPSSSFGSSGIPSAPAWTGYKWGSWRSQNRGTGRSLRPLRTRNWGTRSNNGWSGYNNQNTISESFLRNRPQFVNAPTAPRLPSSSLFSQRKWKSGPYRQRNIRTRNWGFRNGDGWANFNRGIYSNEAALPFNVNRQRFAQDSDIQRSAPISAPIQSNWNNAPIQQQSLAPVMAAPVMAAPIAAAPLPLAAPLTGRKARRAAKKQAKQQAIQNRLLTELNPPIGDPAVNHYRRGAKATVPIAGPAIAGLAAPTGSIGSRRTGRKNNLGRRRHRLAGPTLPVTAASVAPLGYAAPISAAPISAAPLGYPMATAAPISAASVPFIPQQQQRSFVQPQLAQSALPLQSNRHLYSSSEQQVRPLSSNFGQQVMPSNQPLYSAGEPVAAQLMQKQQPTLNAQGIPTTSSIY